MRILSINLCTSMPGHSRKERMAKVKSFIEDNQVDVVLFQEGLAVCPPLYSTPRMLRSWEHLYHEPYVGFPWFYTFRVGVLSVYEIQDKAAAYLEVPQKEWLDALPLPGRRRAVATVCKTNKGLITFVSVHLSSSPKSEDERKRQFAKLILFLRRFPGPLVLGGDFNCAVDNPSLGYFGLLGLELVGQSEPDFIFARGLEGINCAGVLNDGTVTDHYGGLLVELK